MDAPSYEYMCLDQVRVFVCVCGKGNGARVSLHTHTLTAYICVISYVCMWQVSGADNLYESLPGSRRANRYCSRKILYYELYAVALLLLRCVCLRIRNRYRKIIHPNRLATQRSRRVYWTSRRDYPIGHIKSMYIQNDFDVCVPLDSHSFVLYAPRVNCERSRRFMILESVERRFNRFSGRKLRFLRLKITV